jgi:hypothetical protein
MQKIGVYNRRITYEIYTSLLINANLFLIPISKNNMDDLFFEFCQKFEFMLITSLLQKRDNSEIKLI